MASPNMSSVGSGSASAGASIGSEATHTIDIKAPLWDHVTILEKPKTGGGNALWRCKYCPMQKLSSYTRVEAHLLQKGRQGIGKCPNVTYEMLSDMRKEIERCKDLVERSKTNLFLCLLLLPQAILLTPTRGTRGGLFPPSTCFGW